MIKVKINDKSNYVVSNLKYKNYSTLESIILLDLSISILKDDFKLSDEEIWNLLKDYRANIKEVD